MKSMIFNKRTSVALKFCFLVNEPRVTKNLVNEPNLVMFRFVCLPDFNPVPQSNNVEVALNEKTD